MPCAELILKRKEMEAKHEKLQKVFKEAGSDLDFSKVTSLEGDSKAKVEAVQKMNKELEDLGKEIDGLVAIEEASKASAAREALIKGFQQPEPGKKAEGSSLSPGAAFVTAKGFKGYQGGTFKLDLDVPMKTLMTTSAGFAPESIRTGEVVPAVRRPLRVLDLIPKGATNQAAVVYMEQTTRTNNAAERTEGTGAMGEAAIVYTERSDTVQEIAVFIPITSQQLEDVPQIEGIVNDELGGMLMERLDNQCVNGNGTPPNITGILNKTGILTRAHAGDRFDTLFNAAKDVRVTGRSNPNAMIIHPNDWADIRLARTEGGLYILGNPSDPGPERIWGLLKTESDAITENTVIVGDFSPQWIRMYEKRGVVIEITDSHDTYFIYGKYAIRATVRVVLVIKRAAAFCKVTGF